MNKQGRIISDPQEIKKAMAGRLEYLEEISRMCSNSIKRAPQGSLRAYRHGGGFQYAMQVKGGNPGITYIPKGRRDHAAALARKKYDQKLLNSAAAEGKILKKALSLYPNLLVGDIYDSLPEGKRALVQPLDVRLVKKMIEKYYS